MTPTGRSVVAIIAIIAATTLAVIDATQVTAVLGLLGTAFGYVLGDRNGEKRLAGALTVLEADRRSSRARTIADNPPRRTRDGQ